MATVNHQLVEHCTGIIEVMCSDPVGATWVFQVSIRDKRPSRYIKIELEREV